MKKLLLILLCLPLIGFGQKTYIPDDNFEAYLEANGMGDGIQLNDSINYWAIEMLMILDVSNQNISDLTGIQDFIALRELNCGSNQLSSLDLSLSLTSGSKESAPGFINPSFLSLSIAAVSPKYGVFSINSEISFLLSFNPPTTITGHVIFSYS